MDDRGGRDHREGERKRLRRHEMAWRLSGWRTKNASLPALTPALNQAAALPCLPACCQPSLHCHACLITVFSCTVCHHVHAITHVCATLSAPTKQRKAEGCCLAPAHAPKRALCRAPRTCRLPVSSFATPPFFSPPRFAFCFCFHAPSPPVASRCCCACRLPACCCFVNVVL